MMRWWRERGWSLCSADEYREIWQRYGGSVATNPDVVERLSDFSGIGVRYLCQHDGSGVPIAGVATWGGYLALSRKVLKQQGKRDLFDMGNAEVILPIAPDATVTLRHKAEYLSAINEQQIRGLKSLPQGLAMARSPDEYSKKFRYNQRREWRLLEEAGGQIVSMQALTAAEQADIYRRLFELRWNMPTPAGAHLETVFSLLQEFITGSLIFLNGQPVAVQVLFRAESPDWISIEYINGGVDPQERAFSPGSVLSFINTQDAWADAHRLKKELRYSFGRADRPYKDRWCNGVSAYRV